MSGMFKLIENEIAIIAEGGVYKEVPLAVRNNGELYVKMKGGFVRLYADGTTSVGSKCRLDTLHLDASLHKDRFGKLCIGPADDRKPLTAETSYLKIEKE